MSESNISLGTSGWSYAEWEGPFYRKGEKRKLRAYASTFKIAEIDSTFYRNPSPGTVMGWLKYSPSDFIFTAKMPKLITHDKRLGLKGDIKADLNTYFDLMRPLQLGGKLGCFLIQLPPKCYCNYDNLESFFGLLDPMFRYAVEFRNPSWLKDKTWNLLEKYNVTYTIVDEPLLPPEVHLTTDFAYFRWHGKGKTIWFDYKYSAKELDGWVPKIQETSKSVRKVIGFFNNHYHGYAPENCLYLLEQLGLLSDSQKKAKDKSRVKQSQLGSFFR
jgi:uncharacterized protein YecE (DUF72 family)